MAAAAVLALVALPVAAQWSNALGGNDRHDGFVAVAGPRAPAVLWERRVRVAFGRPMVSDGERVVIPLDVQQYATSRIAAYSIRSGKEGWTTELPSRPEDPLALPCRAARPC